jgi:hypothetical protein
MSGTKKTVAVGVWTEDLCDLQGRCSHCTGRAKAGEVGLTELDPDVTVFRTHCATWRHLKDCVDIDLRAMQMYAHGVDFLDWQGANVRTPN